MLVSAPWEVAGELDEIRTDEKRTRKTVPKKTDSLVHNRSASLSVRVLDFQLIVALVEAN